jgi:hypothetical protein
MQDMKASAEKLRAEADYAEQIARSATAVQKRELYERLAAHFRQLAAENRKGYGGQARVKPPQLPAFFIFSGYPKGSGRTPTCLHAFRFNHAGLHSLCHVF